MRESNAKSIITQQQERTMMQNRLIDLIRDKPDLPWAEILKTGAFSFDSTPSVPSILN
jgi:hypothetical protein